MGRLLVLARDRQIAAFRVGGADLAIRSKRFASREGLRGGVLGYGDVAFGAVLVVFQQKDGRDH